MSEICKAPPIAELRFGNFRVDEFLDTASEICPEVSDKKDDLLKASMDLISSHNVEPEFFGAEDNAIGLLFAAALHDEASRVGNKSETRINREKALAGNFARTLFGPYSKTHPHEDVREDSRLEPKERLELFRKYQNPELSQRLHNWIITSQEMQELRDQLQITNGQEQHFEALVLSIGQPLHTKGLGKAPDSPRGMAGYVEELHGQGRTFMAEQLAEERYPLPYAWVSSLQGVSYLCIAEPTARIILEPEAVGYQEAKKGDAAIAQSLVQHEFIHTQGNIDIGNPADTNIGRYLGVILEEYRAETFSGFKFRSAYSDLYYNVDVAEEMRSFDLSELIRFFPLGGAQNKAEFYVLLAARMGLVSTAMLVGLLPEHYADSQSPQSSREIHNTLRDGGFRDELMLSMSEQEFEQYVSQKDISEDAKLDYLNWLAEVRKELA